MVQLRQQIKALKQKIINQWFLLFTKGFVATIPFSAGIIKTLKWFEFDYSGLIVKEEPRRFFGWTIRKFGK